MSSQPPEVNVTIHGNSLTLRGDSLPGGMLQSRETSVSALSLSAAQPSSETGSAGEGQDESQFLLLTLSDSSQETHKAIQATGAEVVTYISDAVYLYKRGQAVDVATLQNIDGVRFVDAYPAVVKVDADLRSEIDRITRPDAGHARALSVSPSGAGSSRLSGSSSAEPVPSPEEATVPLEIHFHEGTSEEAIRSVVNRFISDGCLQRDSVQVFSSMAVADAMANKVDELAAAPEVYVLEPQVEESEDNIFATDVLGVTGPVLLDGGFLVAPDGAAPPGTPSLPYDGTGETISVGDSGFDRGNNPNINDFTGLHTAFTNRADAIKFYCMDTSHDATQGVVTDPACVKDVRGHGTHVCGSAVGNSRQPSPSGAGSAGYIKGSAPGARLAFTQIRTHSKTGDLKDRRMFKGPMKDIYNRTLGTVPQNAPPPIFSESWGVNWENKKTPKPGYEVKVADFDTLLQAEDTLVCRSAGNDGDATDYDGICGRYAAGKNVLTVGACESATSHWVEAYPDVTSNAAKEPQPRSIPGNPTMVAWFSSSGTHENRQKPDVMAPGDPILSAHSRDAGTPDPEDEALDPNYSFMSGTSMATPLTAGCAAVINQALRDTDKSYALSSGTLLKALIINGATSIMDPTQNDPDPQIETGKKRRWGFGRVNVLGSLSHLPVTQGVAANVIAGSYRRGNLKLNGKESWTLNVPKPESTPGCVINDSTLATVKITLCYADLGNAALQGLFYFTLTQASTGKVWFGNRRGWVLKDDAKDKVKRPGYADTFNNVQQIYVTAVEPGNYEIGIEYFQDKSGQSPEVPYAVAWLVF